MVCQPNHRLHNSDFCNRGHLHEHHGALRPLIRPLRSFLAALLGLLPALLCNFEAQAIYPHLQSVTLSPRNGFQPLSDHSGTPLLADTALCMELPAADYFDLHIRLANLSASAQKATGYSLTLTSRNGKSLALHISARSDSGFEPFAGTALFSLTDPDEEPRSQKLEESLFPSDTQPGEIKISCSRSGTEISVGFDELRPLFSSRFVPEGDCTLRIEPDRAARLSIEKLRLRTLPALSRRLGSGLSAAETDSLLASAPLPSSRSLAGVWQLLDFDIDDKFLQLGGDYRLAILPAAEIPALARLCDEKPGALAAVYLSGATNYPDDWHKGMLKAVMTPTAVSGMWRIVWADPEGFSLDGRPLESPADFASLLSRSLHTVQSDSEGFILTIYFPDLYSSIRLLRLP